MTTGSFVHLHNHTEFSMLDGMAKIDQLMAECQRLEMPAVGMTDHGNMYGSSDFYKAAIKSGIKPIIGIEAYLAPGSRFDKKRQTWGDPSQKRDDVSANGAYLHMTMWAKNETGLRNLFTLSSLASYEGQLGKWPRMDADLISQYSDGIIASSGCPSGEISVRLRLGQEKEAYEAAGKWQDIFGKENFYLELMDHGIEIERRIHNELLQLGKDMGMPPLVTNDCHYVTAEQREAHDALLCVQTNSVLTDSDRFRFDGTGYHLVTPQEMRQRWKDLPEACDNTLRIAEMVEDYSDIWTYKDRMPSVELPPGHTAESWLRAEVHRGLERRFPQGVGREYIERANQEIDVIVGKGYPTYFLVVADIVAHAREVGIKVGPGRGSAAGALVAYALGITNLDPVEHGLLFERFLNPERPSAPDIDMDFDDRRRGEIIRYACEKWGADKVAQVITFGTIKTKAAIKDAARVNFGQPGYAFADRMTKELPPPKGAKDISLAGITDPQHPRYNEAADIRRLVETDEADNPYRKIYTTACGLEGMVRQAGVHACAVIMSSEPLMDCIPMWKRPQDGAIITGWDYPSCEAIGLLKMDFLGLRNLTVIGDALENIRRNRGEDIDLENLDLTDEAAYQLLCRGETLGIFQLDGAGMRDLLIKMKPTEFNDITASLALYRPGPMGMKAHLAYARRKNNLEDIQPIHPELDEPLRDILAETYGLIVYQEQIMQIAQKVAGYSLGQADLLRRAMGKKKKEVLDEQFEGFQNGMLERGYSREAIRILWDTIEPFAGYAFNKSHAACYALISYWTAYLKSNYAAEYMAALLTSVRDDKDKTALYLADCRHLGIKVLLPDVNESEYHFTSVGEDIRFGLGAIRNVGEPVVNDIVSSRQGKPYVSFFDYLQKIGQTACTKKVTSSLIRAGAFDSLGYSRKGLNEIYEETVDAVNVDKKITAKGQFDLFAGFGEDTGQDLDPYETEVPTEEWSQSNLLREEREMLGLYVSGHPLDTMVDRLAEVTDCSILDLLSSAATQENLTSRVIGGIIASVDRRINKKGEPWAIVTIEDRDGSVPVYFWRDAYSLHQLELVEDNIVTVNVQPMRRDDGVSFRAKSLQRLEFSPERVRSSFTIRIPSHACSVECIEELKTTLQRYPGSSSVIIAIEGEDRDYDVALPPELSVNTRESGLTGSLVSMFGQGCLQER